MRLATAAFALACATGCGARAPATSAGPAAAAVRLERVTQGAVAQWLLALPANERALFVPTVADLLRRAPAGAGLRVLASDPAVRREVEQALGSGRARAAQRATWLREDGPLSPWACDFFLVGRTPDGAAVALLHHPDHYASSWGAWEANDPRVYLRGLHDVTQIATTHRLEGGQVVAGDHHAFVSRAVLETTLRREEAASEAELRRRLEFAWGLPVAWVSCAALGNSDHCDLYLMPTGDKHVMLADPGLGAELLAAASPLERDRFARRALGLSVEAGLDAAVLRDGAGTIQRLLAGARAPHVRNAHARLRAELEALGYTCHGVPHLFLDPETTGLQMLLSYTNAVQERRGEERTVYLPRYGLPPLDDHAARAWGERGFRVVPIDALGPALMGGSLRCMSQIVRAARPAATPSTGRAR